MSKLIYLVPLFPLAGFLLNGLGRNLLSRTLVSVIAVGAVLASFVMSLLIFREVGAADFQTQVVKLFDFIKVGKVDIPFSFQVDRLSVLFLLIITGVGTLIHLYSTAYMHEEKPPHYARYFAYLNLFVFSMLLLVLGSNYVIMFIGWEGVGLCSYLLIGFWFGNEAYNDAAKKAFVMNRIGDLGFLLAVFWMMMRFGTTDFAQVFDKAPEATAAVMTGITLLLFVGATGKSAQIPLFTWLPDAMAGPTPVSALIHAATMVTAGIYMITRSHVLFDLAPFTQSVIAIIGLSTALLAATIALRQNDIKKVLAYSTVSQLGYMFLALGVGAYTGAIFHVMTHAFFKALLFLGAGSVIHALHHEQDLRNMGGLRRKMPITHITFLIACLAIAGIPPFSGFFSKDEILTAALLKSPVYYVLGVAGALMTTFYMFRLYAMAFRGEFRGTEAQASHLHESPAAMTIPLIILAMLSVAGGWVGIPEVLMPDAHRLQSFLAPVLEGIDGQPEAAHHLSHSTELMLMGGVLVLIIGVITFAWRKFSRYDRTQEIEAGGIARLLENKWYVDELYAAIVSKPLRALSAFMNARVERQLIDGMVNGVGRAVQYGSRQLRLIQSGQVGSYILIMVIFLILFFILQLFWNIQ
ncbi:MAG: NADH-quinone oxidoreductase subunit L [Chitinophagaceae bacterium]|jgi:NADH-quinone oxidoreductase subunit L|nr:NADH-quinone oxidoreductase subunit L [Chitinophagaceae bacterium]